MHEVAPRRCCVTLSAGLSQMNHLVHVGTWRYFCSHVCVDVYVGVCSIEIKERLTSQHQPQPRLQSLDAPTVKLPTLPGPLGCP